MSHATISQPSETMPNTTQDAKPDAKAGRNAKGQFVGGNKGGPGNPFGRRMAAMREAIQRAIGVEDIERVMAMLLAKSLAGDLAATRLLLQYAVGKPKPMVEPDRVEVEAQDAASGPSVAERNGRGRSSATATNGSQPGCFEQPGGLNARDVVAHRPLPTVTNGGIRDVEEGDEVADCSNRQAGKLAATKDGDRPSVTAPNGCGDKRIRLSGSPAR